MKLEGDTKFRDILDGLSNTILCMEVNPDLAVTWSDPQPMKIDLDKPVSQMGKAHIGGCHVLMYDGAVVFITYSIDEVLFRALLTRAGGETIAEQLNQ